MPKLPYFGTNTRVYSTSHKLSGARTHPHMICVFFGVYSFEVHSCGIRMCRQNEMNGATRHGNIKESSPCRVPFGRLIGPRRAAYRVPLMSHQAIVRCQKASERCSTKKERTTTAWNASTGVCRLIDCFFCYCVLFGTGRFGLDDRI